MATYDMVRYSVMVLATGLIATLSVAFAIAVVELIMWNRKWKFPRARGKGRRANRRL